MIFYSEKYPTLLPIQDTGNSMYSSSLCESVPYQQKDYFQLQGIVRYGTARYRNIFYPTKYPTPAQHLEIAEQ
jgi:hypothetical protein